MAGHYAYNAYLQAKVQPETDPQQLILMLYEGALKHLALAREGLEEANACKRGEHLSRAVAIVSELYAALDPSCNDAAIDFLRGLYQRMLVELAKVAVQHDVQALNLTYRYLEQLKNIWEHDVMGLKSPGVVPAPPQAAMSVPTTLSPPSQQQAYRAPAVPGQLALSV